MTKIVIEIHRDKLPKPLKRVRGWFAAHSPIRVRLDQPVDVVARLAAHVEQS